MATNKVTSKTSAGEKPAAGKGSPKKAEPAETAANGPRTVAKAKPEPDKKAPRNQDAPFNAETAQGLRDADAGKNLLHYPSLEAMFEDLDIFR